MSKKPVVSIIICTRNRADDLKDTLEAMRAVHVPADLPTEIIVVDNGSADETPSLLSSLQLDSMTLRAETITQPGKSRALNAGVAAAAGDFLLFSDDDVRPPVNWIAGMTAPLLNGEFHGVSGGIRIAKHLKRPWMELVHLGWFVSTEGFQVDKPGMMAGANMAVHRDVFKKIPAFDIELGPGAKGFSEDLLFSFQMMECGFQLAPALDVEVEHHFDASRLLRVKLLARARAEGRCAAYLWHHWQHTEVSQPRLRALYRQAQLLLLRSKQLKRRSQEGCAEWELLLLRKIQCYSSFALESKRPRTYEKHGLIKNYSSS